MQGVYGGHAFIWDLTGIGVSRRGFLRAAFQRIQTLFIVEARGGKCDSVTEIAPEKRYEFKFSRTTHELLSPVG